MKVLGKLTINTTILIATLCIIASAQAAPKLEEVAERSYLYGLQQAIFYGQRWIYTQNNVKDNEIYSGINRIFWVRKQITPDFPVVTPNATTLYGSGFLDLEAGPVVIEVPEITDRYFSVQVMDQYGIFRMIVGSPFNGTSARKYILVPPGYDKNLPASFPTTDIVQWQSKTAYIVVRMAVETGTDKEIKTINHLQDQVTTTPLAQWIANDYKGWHRQIPKYNLANTLSPKTCPPMPWGKWTNKPLSNTSHC
ncbi:DUF1254 domain-containing protein [Oceanicoccus sp. KOV_DT_Chl]|uniref:DUF1254 domain-containing protein n=1 Tax=Oceanicoccus sp. KOV_DT_Chl TaxID=1904639 RepID=UPI001F2B2345|nr:DUF1254 domain-containing protein [Oceanicoccus sp. KOV_DT_Chl]